ncbi:MAG: enolase C-terminal domain-like protein [Thiohalomonadaceae bacterium]
MDRTPIEELRASAYTVPVDAPESDGMPGWTATTLVLVEARVGKVVGVGYSYTHASAAGLINQDLAACVTGGDAMAPVHHWHVMQEAVRNLGRAGIAATAISAVDAALWDLKARLLGVPLVLLFGPVRDKVPLYGSGSFTSYPSDRLERQLMQWREAGFGAVKMKVGRQPRDDVARVRAAREAIGPDVALFVDANGAYAPRQALEKAEAFAALDVRWFEEPVSSDDLEGMRFVRERVPSGMVVSAGEYAYGADDFLRLLQAGAVDFLQADVTRCGGYTGFLMAAAMAGMYHIPLSSHTAPALHLPVACATRGLEHMEWFHDHVRIEKLFFDGVPDPVRGMLRADLSRPGNGLEFRRSDAARYAV